jgi:serine phosphatase RsbU (regulator of sigma subunit)
MEVRGGNRAVEEGLSTPGLDAWVYNRPYRGAECGGDIYYLSVCGGGEITRLVVADVSGHGETVAGFSESLRDLMRKNINTKSQTHMVGALNRQFAELAQLGRFATAVVATYLAGKRRLTVCNAGHPRPLWYHAGVGAWGLLDVSAYESGNLPLGIDGESPYVQFSVRLGPGDLVVFYSDALTESADPSGRLLGEEGLLALARGLDPADPRGAGPALLAGIDAHRGGRPADDDTTLIALHHNASGTRRRSLVETLDVYAKVFGLRSYVLDV